MRFWHFFGNLSEQYLQFASYVNILYHFSKNGNIFLEKNLNFVEWHIRL